MTANQLHQHLRNLQTKRTRVVADELQCVEAEAVDHLAGLRVVVVAKGEMVSPELLQWSRQLLGCLGARDQDRMGS